MIDFVDVVLFVLYVFGLFVVWRRRGRSADVEELERMVAALRLERDQLVEEAERERALLVDALVEARAEVNRLRDELRSFRRSLSSSVVGEQRLLVVLSPDAGMSVDLAALRGVRQSTGLSFKRLVGVSREVLARHLDRARFHGHPWRLVHMGVHSGPDGVVLGDGVVSGAWLSEHMQGVEVLLLAGCSSDVIGDWLSVVPFVVTLSEDIPQDDAARLTAAFWSGIGSGLSPSDALLSALSRVPPSVAEYVERHW